MAHGHELEELVVGVMELTLLLCERLKDGLQPGDDIPAVIAKLQDDAVFTEAVKGVVDIPTEVANLGVMDYLALSGKVVMYVPKIVGIFLKK